MESPPVQDPLERARAMCDSWAHLISEIVVQADGARAIRERFPEDCDEALLAIADRGRTVLASIRAFLGEGEAASEIDGGHGPPAPTPPPEDPR